MYRHVFDKISTEFRGISRIYLNFVAPRPREISEVLADWQTDWLLIADWLIDWQNGWLVVDCDWLTDL